MLEIRSQAQGERYKPRWEKKKQVHTYMKATSCVIVRCYQFTTTPHGMLQINHFLKQINYKPGNLSVTVGYI